VVSSTDPLLPYSRFSRPESLLFLPIRSSIVLMMLSGPHSRPATSQKMVTPEIEPAPLNLWRSQILHMNRICLKLGPSESTGKQKY
jgi:hypothetical protein